MAARLARFHTVLGLFIVGLLAVALGACGSAAEDADDAADVGDAAPTEDVAGPPQVPSDTQDFDPERSREQAESFLGVAEDEVEEAIADSIMARIMRRGDEQLFGTMDLRPGRLNIELDPDDEGVYRVTRVVVETTDGSDIVVE